ncbi:MAG: potassium transporter TrkG [Caldilineaceae bacterium]
MRDKRRTPTTQPYVTTIPIGNTNDPETADIVDRLTDRPKAKRALEGPWVMIVGFAIIILCGTVLLKLPAAAAPGTTISWEEAFFTATSATTVTGLAVRSTVNDFSWLGQIFILLLLQVGGVGFIAFSVLLYRLIGRRITLQTRFLVQQSLGTNEASGVAQLALFVLAVTLTLEATGAFFLWLRWRATMSDGEALWLAIFHAVSSYCNAGFDLFAGAGRGVLFGYGTDWFTLIVMGALIILGGLGITVMYDLWSYRRDRMLSLHTRLTLLLTLLLTVAGMTIMFIDRDYNSPVLNNMSLSERTAVELFTVVSARTAGVTIIPLEQLSESTQLMLLLWMFIGGAPASMAGGVTTSTLAVLLVAVVATARGHQAAVTFGRTLPLETIAKAVAIMTVSSLLVVVVTMALALRHQGSLFVAAFEVISAFSNTGYSLNFTGELDSFGRYLIALTMFWGASDH